MSYYYLVSEYWHGVSGAVSALDEENACPSSHLTRVTNAASGEGQSMN